MREVLTCIPAAFMAALGAKMLFSTRRQLAEAQFAHEQRLQERLARGSDAFADELRSLEAYRPITSIRQRRSFGALLLALAATFIALTIFA